MNNYESNLIIKPIKIKLINFAEFASTTKNQMIMRTAKIFNNNLKLNKVKMINKIEFEFDY